jgi:cytochrome c biogenesis protein CcmG/thiol:disulfide interchange protein DsbE
MKSQVLYGRLTPNSVRVTLVAVSLVTSVPVSANITRAALRKDAPGFSLIDSKGASVKLSDYKGRVVLLDFWATWCTGCKVEIPWYVEFQKKYEGKGLASIGVAMDEEGWEKVKPYLAEHQINYPVVIGDLDFLSKKFGLPPSLPMTLLIDRNGKIAETHPGLVEKDVFEREILQLLQEKAK